MKINNIEYKFYEISDFEYILLAAESEEKAKSLYLDYVNKCYDYYIEEIRFIREVTYEYARNNFDLNPKLVNHQFMLNKGCTFNEIVKEAVTNLDDDGFLLLGNDQELDN